MSESRRPLVEILYFDGCPNHEPAVALVERIDSELGTNAEVRLVNVPDRDAANRLRFLGSPTIRVDGVAFVGISTRVEAPHSGHVSLATVTTAATTSR